MDKLSPERRSENMRNIRGENTAPELAVRELCRKIGFAGYRIHRKELPGKPDIAWIVRKLAIFVHGCFWHGHDCTEGLRKPKSNRAYWIPKIQHNHQRDLKNLTVLRASGWKVLIIWECEIKDMENLEKKLIKFFKKPNKPISAAQFRLSSSSEPRI